MKQEETVIENVQETPKPIESITVSISEGEKDENGAELGPLVVISLLSKEDNLMTAKFPAPVFNTPSGYGHAIELTINSYTQQYAQKNNSRGTENTEY